MTPDPAATLADDVTLMIVVAVVAGVLLWLAGRWAQANKTVDRILTDPDPVDQHAAEILADLDWQLPPGIVEQLQDLYLIPQPRNESSR